MIRPLHIDVTDGISRSPRQLTISGVKVSSNWERGTVEDLVIHIEAMREKRTLVTVVCPDGLSLKTAFIVSFDYSKDVTISNGLKVSMVFSEVIAMPSAITRGKATIKVKPDPKSGNAMDQSNKTTSKGNVTSKQQLGNTSTNKVNSFAVCKSAMSRENELINSSDPAVRQAVLNCRNANFSTSTAAEQEAANKKAALALGFNPNKAN